MPAAVQDLTEHGKAQKNTDTMAVDKCIFSGYLYIRGVWQAGRHQGCV